MFVFSGYLKSTNRQGIILAEPCHLISDLMFGGIRQKSNFIQIDPAYKFILYRKHYFLYCKHYYNYFLIGMGAAIESFDLCYNPFLPALLPFHRLHLI